MEGLEALEKIKKRFYYDFEYCINFDEMTEEINSIEQELKDLEFIKKCFYVSSSGGVFKTDFGDENIEKLKETLL